MPNGNNNQLGYTDDPQFAAMQQRVYGIEQNLSSLSTSINQTLTSIKTEFTSFQNNVNNKLEEKNKTPWAVVIGFGTFGLSVVSFLGYLAFTPLKQDIVKTQDNIEVVRSTTVPKDSYLEFKNTYENNRITSRNEYIDKFGTINKNLDDKISRDEFIRTLEATNQRFVDQQRQMDLNTQDLKNIYSTRDVVRDMNARLQDLEKTRIMPMTGIAR